MRGLVLGVRRLALSDRRVLCRDNGVLRSDRHIPLSNGGVPVGSGGIARGDGSVLLRGDGGESALGAVLGFDRGVPIRSDLDEVRAVLHGAGRVVGQVCLSLLPEVLDLLLEGSVVRAKLLFRCRAGLVGRGGGGESGFGGLELGNQLFLPCEELDPGGDEAVDLVLECSLLRGVLVPLRCDRVPEREELLRLPPRVLLERGVLLSDLCVDLLQCIKLLSVLGVVPPEKGVLLGEGSVGPGCDLERGVLFDKPSVLLLDCSVIVSEPDILLLECGVVVSEPDVLLPKRSVLLFEASANRLECGVVLFERRLVRLQHRDGLFENGDGRDLLLECGDVLELVFDVC